MTVRYRTAPTVPSGAVTQPTRRRDGPPHCPLHGLASDGVCTAHDVTAMPVVSYTAIPPLLRLAPKRYYFCCTIHGVTPSGRYPASCPVKPGLSSHTYSPMCAAERIARGDRVWYFQALVLYGENTSSNELSYDRIMRDLFAAHSDEVVEEFQKPLCFKVHRIVLADTEEQRLCGLF